jgi:RNA polymerase sigma-70 factor (ECF subfamily)
VYILPVPRVFPAPTESFISLSFLKAARAEEAAAPSALEEEVTGLFNQLRNPLLRYLLSFGLSVHDGEEVIQEVFLSLFRHLQQGKSRQNLRGWVFRVGHNLALKQRMRNSRTASARCDESAAQRQLAPDPNPEECLAQAQRRRRLLAVVRALPEQDRNCLYLRAEGLRYREIAEVLGISLGGVSLSLARSLTRLSNADGR